MKDDAIRLKTECLRLRGALYDRITGLPALPVLFDELRSLLDQRRAIGVLHVGVTNLPLVESIYGWQTFDRIVGEQAEAVTTMIGGILPREACLAQEGIHGEELIVVLPVPLDGSDLGAAHLQKTAAKVEGALRRLYARDDFATIVPRLEARVGFSLLSENPFFRFERLVYRAVEEARVHALRRDERRRRSWGAEIQAVIREGRIVVHYQPVVNLDTLEVIGYEALSRGPKGSGFESAAVLFARSEDAGLSAELDRVCRRAALASATGIGRSRKIFVNTRADHLADPDWQDPRLEERLAGLGLAPADLVFEFPETGAQADDSAIERSVAGLRDRGFRFAIDDIGTGYAGIHAIERLRPDYLKLDISLVRKIESNLIQQDLLGSLVTIGRRIGSAVIAEGIESEDELKFLRTHGARYGQGFLFSMATPVMVEGPFVLGRDP